MLILEITLLLFLFLVIFWLLCLIIAQATGAPVVYANKNAVVDSLRLAGLKKGELLVDLGCGNARTLLLAAEKFQARGIGVDRSLYCYLTSRIKVALSPRSKDIKILFGDFKSVEKDLQKADVVYLYLLNSVLPEIEDWLFAAVGAKTKIVSLAFEFKKHQPLAEIETYNLGRKTKARLYQK